MAAECKRKRHAGRANSMIAGLTLTPIFFTPTAARPLRSSWGASVVLHRGDIVNESRDGRPRLGESVVTCLEVVDGDPRSEIRLELANCHLRAKVGAAEVIVSAFDHHAQRGIFAHGALQARQ